MITRNCSFFADFNHPDLKFLKQSSPRQFVLEATISPSGDFLVVNYGGTVLCLLDAHSLQILSLAMLMEADKSSICQLSNVFFLEESLLGVTDINQRLVLWRVSSLTGLTQLVRVDYFDKHHTDRNIAVKLEANISPGGGILNKKLSKPVSLGDIAIKPEFKAEDLWNWKESNSHLLFAGKRDLAASRLLEPSLLYVIDNSGSLKVLWIEPMLNLFAIRSPERARNLAGNMVSTDKLIQHLKECQNTAKSLPTMREPSGLTLKLEEKQPIHFALARINGKQFILVLCYNLELIILDGDLIRTGFMEHQCYINTKR